MFTYVWHKKTKLILYIGYRQIRCNHRLFFWNVILSSHWVLWKLTRFYYSKSVLTMFFQNIDYCFYNQIFKNYGHVATVYSTWNISYNLLFEVKNYEIVIWATWLFPLPLHSKANQDTSAPLVQLYGLNYIFLFA